MSEDNTQKPLAILGREGNISGFRAFGFQVYPLPDISGLAVLLESIAASGAAVCLVEEEIFRGARQEFEKYRKDPLPVFLPFSASGGEGVLEEMIKEIRLKATGAL
ncbi:MAG: V-type ATP synthase subunit F [Candidatus Omnitrophota bacterium]|jgi:vacuolar-type H+-ATPase subunit F/Vma7